MSKLSTAQRISIAVVVLAFPLLFVLTREWPASVAAIGLPFLYPVAIVLLAWSLAKTEARVGPLGRPRPPVANTGLGLSGPPPTRVGSTGIRTVTGQIGFIMAVACGPGAQHMFPRDAGFSEALMLVHWAWWMAAAVFIGFGLPRLVPHGGAPS